MLCGEPKGGCLDFPPRVLLFPTECKVNLDLLPAARLSSGQYGQSRPPVQSVTSLPDPECIDTERRSDHLKTRPRDRCPEWSLSTPGPRASQLGLGRLPRARVAPLHLAQTESPVQSRNSSGPSCFLPPSRGPPRVLLGRLPTFGRPKDHDPEGSVVVTSSPIPAVPTWRPLPREGLRRRSLPTGGPSLQQAPPTRTHSTLVSRLFSVCLVGQQPPPAASGAIAGIPSPAVAVVLL